MMANQTAKSPRPSSPCLVRLLALLLALLLGITLPLSLLTFDVWRVIFNPPLVKEIITDEVVNSNLIPISLEWFSEQRADERVAQGEALTGVDEPDIVLLLSFLDRDDWRAIKQQVLTDEFLANLVSVTVDGIYRWIDTDERTPQITWDLRPFIERVNGQPGTNVIVIAYDNLPDCTEAQIQDFLTRLSAAPPNTEVLYNLCKFPAPWQEDQFSDYQNALFKVVENIPNEFSLTNDRPAPSSSEDAGPAALKRQLRLIRFTAQWAWLVPLGLVLLLAALIVRSQQTLGKWVGIPLLLGGGLTLLVALALPPLLIGVLASGPLSETPPIIAQELSRIISRISGEIFRPMTLQASLIGVLGLALLIVGLIKGKGAPAPPAGQTATEH